MKILSVADGKAIVSLTEKELYLITSTDDRGMKNLKPDVEYSIDGIYARAQEISNRVDWITGNLKAAMEQSDTLIDVLNGNS